MALGKNIFYTLLTQIPTLLIGITSGIFLNQMLTPTGKGIWALLQTNVDIFSTLAVMGLPTAMLYFVSGNRMPVAKIMGIATLAVTGFAVLLGITLGLTQGTPFYNFIMPTGPNQAVYIFYLFVYFFALSGQGILDNLLIAHSKIRRLNQLSLFASITTLITALLLFYVFRAEDFYDTLVYFLLAQSAMFLLLLSFRIRLYARLEGEVPSFKLSWKNHLQPILAFSLITYVGQLFNSLNYRLVMWMLEDQHGTADVGLFTVSLHLAQLLWLFAFPMQAQLISYQSRQDISAEEKALRLTFFLRLVNTLSIGAAVFLSIIAHFVIELLYKEAYLGAVLPFIILLPGIVCMNFSKILTSWFISQKKIYNLLIGNGIGLSIILILNITLIPPFGLIGAAISATGCFTTIMLFHIFSYLFIYKQPLRNMFVLTPKDLKMLLKGKLPV